VPHLHLDDRDRATLAGELGAGAALAMRVVVRVAVAQGAARLIDVTGAHIDSCLFHGIAGLDFAARLVDGGATVSVPTTLNVASLDLLHPELYRGDPETAALARRLMDLYVEMGARPTWTCAPYQLPVRPGLGEHVAWAESNAIVFANSVLGARTERYGDFIDIAAAVTGRVPEAGLHLDRNRLATVVVEVEPDGRGEAVYPVLGHLLGKLADGELAAVVGLEDVTEDKLKALGAAGASSGAMAMFHAVGFTPEAPDLDSATGGRAVPALRVTAEMMAVARAELTTATGEVIDAVCLGTPHASVEELRALAAAVAGARLRVPTFVNTGRDMLAGLGPERRALEEAGVSIVTDTCTYITPILDPAVRVVMTDSAKWAYYAPANLGIDVVYGSMAECVEAAVTGRAGG
jgi:hypothetical protein